MSRTRTLVTGLVLMMGSTGLAARAVAQSADAGADAPEPDAGAVDAATVDAPAPAPDADPGDGPAVDAPAADAPATDAPATDALVIDTLAAEAAPRPDARPLADAGSFVVPPGAGARLKVLINFQIATTVTPPGYIADIGEIYGMRDGQSYGWNQDSALHARERMAATSPDIRYDTLIHMQKPDNPDAFWEIAVPNGNYLVRIVSGDSNFTDSVFKLAAEDVLVVSGSPDPLVSNWVEGAATVRVSDGRLTISNAPEAGNNKICFIEIYDNPMGDAGVRLPDAAPMPDMASGTGGAGGMVMAMGGAGGGTSTGGAGGGTATGGAGGSTGTGGTGGTRTDAGTVPRKADDGCGCRVGGQYGSVPGIVILPVIGLVLALRRRRR